MSVSAPGLDARTEMDFLPPPKKKLREPLEGVSIKVPASLLERFDRMIADRKYNRTDMLLHLIRVAVEEHEASKGEPKK